MVGLVFSSSCDSDDSHDGQLPPITTAGKGTFGCFVHGNVFLNEGLFGFGNGLYAELQVGADVARVILYAGNYATKQNLILSIKDTPTLQVGKIYDLQDSEIVQYIEYSADQKCYYDVVLTGTMELLKFEVSNPQNRIISGKFEFTASSVDCQSTVVITEGRFDTNDVQ